MSMKTLILIGCLFLFSSVVMDSYLWVVGKHWVPSWTMAVMSAGLIVALLYIRELLPS